MKTSLVRHKIGNLILEQRYPLYFGVAVYKDQETNIQYVLLLKDIQKVNNRQQFLNFAIQIS
jgi:hypothetical protein